MLGNIDVCFELYSSSLSRLSLAKVSSSVESSRITWSSRQDGGRCIGRQLQSAIVLPGNSGFRSHKGPVNPMLRSKGGLKELSLSVVGACSGMEKVKSSQTAFQTSDVQSEYVS